MFEKTATGDPSTSPDSAVVNWLLVKMPIEVLRQLAGVHAQEIEISDAGTLESFMSAVWVAR